MRGPLAHARPCDVVSIFRSYSYWKEIYYNNIAEIVMFRISVCRNESFKNSMLIFVMHIN